MENFFVDYRDPIFGLIILIGVAFIIAFISYGWGIFSTKDEETKLEEFVKKFDSKQDLSNKEILKNLDTDTALLFATVFTKSGDFENAINVYLSVLEKVETKKEKDVVLVNLGKVYFEAGFYKKAEDIFLEVVKFNPRNQISLKFLSVIYEKLKMNKNELEVLDSLKEQGVDIESSIVFVKAQIIANDSSLVFSKKIKEIRKISRHLEFIDRFILELFIKHKEPLSKIDRFPNLNSAIDIVWHLNEPVNLKDKEYKALFYAKGLNSEYEKSSFFEINALSAMRKDDFKEADLSFKYICNKCKSSYPYHFYRCPKCYSLDSTKILPKIIRRDDEISLPF